MNFFLTGLKLSFVRRMRNIKFWVILLLLPALILTVQIVLPKESAAAPVQIGVALPESGGEAFWELLEDRSGTVMSFIQADPDIIDRNVASGKWDCGLILPEDFAQRVEDLDTYRLITLRIGAGSVVYPLVQETVASCMSILSSGQIAESYLLSSGIVADRANLPSVSVPTDPREGVKQVQIHMHTPDGAQMDALNIAESGIKDLLLWVICGFMLVWMLMRGADLGAMRNSGTIRRMRPVRSTTVILAGFAGADWIGLCVSAMIAMTILGANLTCYIAIVVFGFFLYTFALFAAHFPAIWKSIPVFPPFVVLISLLFAGALVDMGTLLPKLSPVISWLPGKLYMDICHGNIMACLPLLGASGVFILVSIILDRIKK